MDSHAILCPRIALCSRYDHLGHHVQTIGNQQCRASLLYRLAEFALGHQTIMEPVHRLDENQALVDYHHAIAYRSRIGGYRLYGSDRTFFPMDISYLLVNGIQFGHP